MTKAQAKKIIKLLETIDIDVLDTDIIDIDNAEDLREFLQENNHFDVEIKYHDRAMDYLKNNDTSMQKSMEIAHRKGYRTDHLNSKLLASMLLSQDIEEAYGELESYIEEILE